MIGYVWPNNADAIRDATDRSQVNRAVEDIVKRMPTPRIFVATPLRKGADTILTEQLAFYKVVEALIAQGKSVIDPSLIATLLTYNKTWSTGASDEQLLFLHLATAQMISCLWLPMNWRHGVRLVAMHGVAQARQLRIENYVVPE